MFAHGLARLRRFARCCVDKVRARVSQWTKPHPRSLATRLATDLVRRRHDLLLEHCVGYFTHPRRLNLRGHAARR